MEQREMIVFRIEMLPATFTKGLPVPARLRLLQDGEPLDLQGPARRNNPFWKHFKDCAFARAEMQAAIRRCRAMMSDRQRAALVKSVEGLTQVPNEVDDGFKRLFEAFDQVTMAICYDPACAEMGCKHAHAYRRAAVIAGATFRTVQEARAWIASDHGRSLVDGLNAIALERRIRDWPGMTNVSSAVNHSTP